MKKLFSIFALAAFGFTSCNGPQGPIGPQGPQGPQGLDGGLEYATAIEMVVDFTPANGFSHLESFGFDVFPADVPLIYIKWEEDENGTEILRPLPQTAYFSDGLLVYNFDFTQGDFSIFLDGTVPDFAKVDPSYLNEQVFRVVVVPAAFLSSGRMADKSYKSVTEALNLSDADFVKRDVR